LPSTLTLLVANHYTHAIFPLCLITHWLHIAFDACVEYVLGVHGTINLDSSDGNPIMFEDAKLLQEALASIRAKSVTISITVLLNHSTAPAIVEVCITCLFLGR